METGRFTLKGFQKNMLIRFISIAAMSAVIAPLLFFIMTKKRLEDVLYTFHLPRSIDDFLLPYVLTANLAGLLIVIIALILTMKSTFWRVAGPLYRVSQDVQKLIDGDLCVNIRLRKADEFKDIAEDFDQMGKSMREKFRRIKDDCTKLSTTAADMGIHHADKDLLREKNAILGKTIDGLKEGLNAFKI